MAALLQFDALDVTRGDRVLLRALAGSVQPGQVLHIRGANGSGKTSLLEVLAGLRAPGGGQVGAPPAPGFHWIGHRNGLSGALSPFENLRFWCDLNEVPAEGARAALREFELEPVADVPCRELSAGQRRRSALARLAAAHRPFWFLDEPLSSLDEAGVRHWLSLLDGHCGRGGGAIVTSHQPLPLAGPHLRTLDLA